MEIYAWKHVVDARKNTIVIIIADHSLEDGVKIILMVEIV